MKLYEISENYQRALETLFDPETGEINETSLALLDKSAGDFQTKGLSVVHYIRNMETSLDAIDREVKRLDKIKKRIEKESEWLRSYLLNNMTANGIKEISCPYLTIKTRINGESLDVQNEKMIPQKYFDERTVYKLDRIRLKKDLQKGEQVMGAGLKRTVSLKIG